MTGIKKLPGIKKKLPGIKIEVPGIKFEVPGIKFEVPGIKFGQIENCQALNFNWVKLPGIKKIARH